MSDYDWSYRKPRRGIKRLRPGDVVRVFYTDPQDAAPAPEEHLGRIGVVVERTALSRYTLRDPAFKVAFPGDSGAFWWNELEVLRRAPRPAAPKQLRLFARRGKIHRASPLTSATRIGG